MKVLFVCEDNACASIVAEDLTRSYWGYLFEVASAGIRPLGRIPDEVKCSPLYWDYRPRSLKEVNVQDFDLIISFHLEPLEEFLPASFAGKVEDWSAIIGPCYEHTDNFDKYKETMYLLLSVLLIKATAYPKKDGIYCKVHHVAMSQKEVQMTNVHTDYFGTIENRVAFKQLRKIKSMLFPNIIEIIETSNYPFNVSKNSLQLSCPECEEAKILWNNRSTRYRPEMPEDKEGKMRDIAQFYLRFKIPFDKTDLVFYLEKEEWRNAEDLFKFLHILRKEGVEFNGRLANSSKLD